MAGPARLPDVEQHSVVAIFRHGDELAVPADAVDAAGIEDGQRIVVEPREGAVVVRPMTAEEEVDAGLVEDLGSGDEFLAALRRDLKHEEWFVPTYARTARFWREFRRLSPAQQRAFLAAVERFVDNLARGEFDPALRVKRVQGKREVWEITWAPDGRATFS